MNDPWEREERMREAQYSRVEPIKRFSAICPRCQRFVYSSLLMRPHWRENGPKVCDSCRRWEAAWDHVEHERADDLKHRRKLK